jgi:hypothetical protein
VLGHGFISHRTLAGCPKGKRMRLKPDGLHGLFRRVVVGARNARRCGRRLAPQLALSYFILIEEMKLQQVRVILP